MAVSYQTTQTVLDDIRTLTNKDSNTLSDTILLRSANKHYLWLVRELNQGEYTNGQISTSDLVLGQQEYPLPIDDTSTTFGGGLVQLLRVEACLDGANWYIVPKTDMFSDTLPTTGNAPYNNFTTSDPHYALFDNSIWFYPTPGANVTGGYKIYWVQRPNELAASTIPDISKDFLGVLESFIHSDALTILGRTQEAIAKKQEAFQMLERAKQLNESFDNTDFVMKPKKNISTYK
jgi:hypothetical protein